MGISGGNILMSHLTPHECIQTHLRRGRRRSSSAMITFILSVINYFVNTIVTHVLYVYNDLSTFIGVVFVMAQCLRHGAMIIAT